MKLTPKRIESILQRHSQLLSLAHDFVVSKGVKRFRDVHFDEDGNVSYWVNTACHCHPSYEKEMFWQSEFVQFVQQSLNN
jgi:hypothetical protein